MLKYISFKLGSEKVRATPRQKLELTVSLGRISTDVLTNVEIFERAR